MFKNTSKLSKALILLIKNILSNTFILRNVDNTSSGPKTNETHFIKNALTVQILNIEKVQPLIYITTTSK